MASRYDDIMKTKPYLPFNMGGSLTEAVIAKAQKELGETEEVKAKTIPELRRLIQEEPGLACPTDDAYLLQYLRPRKFNVQKAFTLLKNFYDVKKSNADLYGSFDREALVRTYGLKAGFALPYRDEDGCAIVMLRLQNWDYDVTNASQAVTALTIILLMCVQEPTTQVCGVRLLIDVRGVGLRQIRSLVPRHVQLFAKALKNCLPIRFKGIHLYNESTIFHYMWSILKLFMTEKIKNRIHLHGDNQKHLHKLIPKAILPVEDYGGENPNDAAAWFNSEIEKNYFEFFGKLTTYGYRQ